MKYLITGANGFLGGRLSIFLENKGFEIIRGTRNSKIKESSKYENWVITEFSNFESLKNICKDVDYIIHAAGPNADYCKKNPKLAFDFYSLETKKFCKAAKAAKIKKFIFLSTAHVYNNKFEGLINEKLPTLNKHPYALSNLEGERVIRKIFGKNPDNSIILRLSNIFGFPDRKEVNCWMLFINNLCKEIVERESITIKSNPFLKRDFVPVNDFCEIILKLSDSNFVNKENNIINFGSEKVVSLLHTAKLIKQIYFNEYKKEIKITIKGKMKTIQDFRFCNQILEENNLNIKFKDSEYIEIKRLLNKCKKYFAT
ncbi:SDR family oxidoreductase [Prochlorococcus sp. AH-716-D22]|nr:SDR family oxidoreductase [Prochlorococcus sp. AH-716-D22]